MRHHSTQKSHVALGRHETQEHNQQEVSEVLPRAHVDHNHAGHEGDRLYLGVCDLNACKLDVCMP